MTDIKEKFKDLGTLGGSDVTWLFMKIKDLEIQLSKTTKERDMWKKEAESWKLDD